MTAARTPEQKVILCGEYGVGKSSLFRRFTSNYFTSSADRKSTLGLDHYSKLYHLDGKDIKLQLWDTGGMERIGSITSSYYKFSDAAILVFSLDSQETFHMLSQHVLDIVSYAENAKIYICGNKSDLKTNRQVSDSDIQSLCEQFNSLIAGTYITSCKSGEGVEEMFSSIAKQLVELNFSKIELERLIQDQCFRVSYDEEPENNRWCSC